MAKEVKLLGFWSSPFAFRIIWALKLKGVDFEYIEEDIFNKSNLLMELNPVHKRVPVLVHGNKVIAESFVILEYIDETWPQNPLLPQDPFERAMARFWAKFAEEKLLDAAWIATKSQGEGKQSALAEALEALEKIEAQLKKKQFFGGEKVGYLDIAMGWISYWLPIWEQVGSVHILDELKFPALKTWVCNFLDHPIVKEGLPPREEMLVYFHKRNIVIENVPYK